MKKFIIGFMCVILLSCHHVANPAFASVPKGQLTAQLTNTNEELSLCKDISAFAYVAMQAHQNGVNEEDQRDLAPTPTNQDEANLKLLLDSIVNDAYIFPIYEDQEDKIEISERFSKVVYDICKGDK